jgi:hypothetical protein
MYILTYIDHAVFKPRSIGPDSLEREAPSGSAENLQRIFEMSYQRS